MTKPITIPETVEQFPSIKTNETFLYSGNALHGSRITVKKSTTAQIQDPITGLMALKDVTGHISDFHAHQPWTFHIPQDVRKAMERWLEATIAFLDAVDAVGEDREEDPDREQSDAIEQDDFDEVDDPLESNAQVIRHPLTTD
ncbi:MAG: hypothetical protein ACPGO3_15975 [Magnetospiraceae bacterium]